ncbi:universal stress protein [Piscirickettsia salmonis]|uniref:universal stress protein n=1 Tax=Piscirickettsia salmonis TaxID=1238 RepID=UPI0007C98327|nr:hypothetical protein A0O36_02776 [Piscirickettsiaceae bacterium NZ-RLO1]
MAKKYQHVMFATDLNNKNSNIDIEAAQEAQDLANLFSAKFSLLHVVQPIASAYGYIGDYGLEKQLVQEAQIQMEKISKELNVNEEDTYIIEGQPKEDIINFSKEVNVDLLVLQGHRHHFLGILGSTANTVINKAECDVMVLATGKK